MTTNAFIFAWGSEGIESVVPITQYEHFDRDNTMNILKGESSKRNPLNSILQGLLMRARFNTQRHMEIYSIDCESESMDSEFWWTQWTEYPQETADLIRERGQKIFSDRVAGRTVIT